MSAIPRHDAVRRRTNHVPIAPLVANSTKEVATCKGEIIKNYGDGSLCIFSSVLDAVLCTESVQEQLRNLSNYERGWFNSLAALFTGKPTITFFNILITYTLRRLYCSLGNKEKALEYLKKARFMGAQSYFYAFQYDRFLSPLHQHPEFFGID